VAQRLARVDLHPDRADRRAIVARARRERIAASTAIVAIGLIEGTAPRARL